MHPAEILFPAIRPKTLTTGGQDRDSVIEGGFTRVPMTQTTPILLVDNIPACTQ